MGKRKRKRRSAVDVVREVADDHGISLGRVRPSKRVTVAHSTHRKPAEEFAERERERHPTANVHVSGEPGAWRVRRDRVASDPAKVACVVLRGL